MAIYRYKRSVLVDFIIERPFFPSDWARACRDWRVQPYGFTATRVPARPVVDSNHRSHRRQIYSVEQTRRIPEVFGVVPLLFPCFLDKYHSEVDALYSNIFA